MSNQKFGSLFGAYCSCFIDVPIVAITREGYPTPAQVIGKKNAGQYWHGSSIKLILSNPHYVGDLVQGRQTTVSVISNVREEVPKDKQIVIENAHTALISREDFEAVRQYMLGRKQKQAKPKAKMHLFTNYMFCADCGQSHWYVQYRKGYVCGNYYKHGKYACSQHSVKDKELIAAILEDIRSMAKSLNEKDFDGRVEAKARQAKEKSQKQIQALQSRIAKLKDEKKGLIKLLASRTISEADYREVAESNNMEISSLQDKLQNLSVLNNDDDSLESVQFLKNEIKQFMELNELTTDMLHRLVNKIEVQADGKVSIDYKFAAAALISA